MSGLKNQAVPVPADELAQLRLDAARYRFFRGHRRQFEKTCKYGFKEQLDEEIDAAIKAAIDAAIDAQRMEQGFGAALELTKKAIVEQKKWQPFLDDPDPEYRK